MASILVVDDMTILREPIAASLRLAGHETFCAADGVEALREARAHKPDVILLDAAMPNMDGIAFLKVLRSDPTIARTRVIMLTASSEKKHIVAAASLGVKDYLLKSRFRLADLLERLKRPDGPTPAPAGSVKSTPVPTTAERTTPGGANATNGAKAAGGAKATDGAKSPGGAKAPVGAAASVVTEIPRLLSREHFLERIEKAFQAKTLSGVVAQVIATAGSPRGDMAQLADLISRDPMLSARVLQAANSASYASAGPVVTTILAAIRKVGFSSVRNIAAALGVFDCMPDAGADGFNPIRCWQHSFAVAQLCERLATAGIPEQAGLAYVVGLCHDLGDILIRTQFSKEYQQLIETAERTGTPKEQLHVQMLGMTPGQMIGKVLKCMGLPDAIREPIEAFHSQNRLEKPAPLTRVLWMAENYANGAMLASSPISEVAPLSQPFCRAAVGEENPAKADPAALRSQVLSLTVTLAGLSRGDEAKLVVPMFEPRATTLWIARNPGMSDFDPVSLALESLAKVNIQERLPVDGETGGLDGLVIVSSSSTAAGFSDRDIEAVLASVRATGRTLPVLAITCDGTVAERQNVGIPWRASVALSDLATFAEPAAKAPPAQVAA